MSEPSDESLSILRSLLSRTQADSLAEETKVYSLPPLWADLRMQLKFLPTDAARKMVRVKGLTLRFAYDYYPLSENRVHVRINGESNTLPLILCTTDESGRGAGRGSFSRFFQVGTSIKIEPQQRIGLRKFLHWKEAGEVTGTSKLEFVASKSVTYTAVYSPR
jgi:hypothetical protein